MAKITLTADEKLIKRAQARARAEKTTLTKEFRRWLEDYAGEAAGKSSQPPQGNIFSRSVGALKEFEKRLETKL